DIRQDWPMRIVDASKVLRPREHVDQYLIRHRHLECRIGLGRNLAQPIPDYEQKVRRHDPLHKSRITTKAQVADILVETIVDNILRTEACRNRQIVLDAKARDLL